MMLKMRVYFSLKLSYRLSQFYWLYLAQSEQKKAKRCRNYLIFKHLLNHVHIFRTTTRLHLWRFRYVSHRLPRHGGAPQWSNGCGLDHRSLPPLFESRRGEGAYPKVVSSLTSLITFGGRSAHLAYRVHKSGHKTPIITSIIIHIALLSRISWKQGHVGRRIMVVC